MFVENLIHLTTEGDVQVQDQCFGISEFLISIVILTTSVTFILLIMFELK